MIDYAECSRYVIGLGTDVDGGAVQSVALQPPPRRAAYENIKIVEISRAEGRRAACACCVAPRSDRRLHVPDHGLRRGIQRGTLALYKQYGAPNRSSNRGSSESTK